ncbi:zona pellucida sperm-binding protein 3 [Cheilinus undulatus]|uniref:zona pellucida sperm-binding protein 3 n=1 Tax=Cheilinus undulatus TaxID=241271 RepID=UPI001BD624E8|nr:zona pellucida sperm-binding protein 3 [Cheilinus undulatus]
MKREKVEALQCVAMKTKWHLCILWIVLSLGILSCSADTSQSPFTKSKKLFRLGTPKSKPTKVGRKSSLRSSSVTAHLSRFSSQRPSQTTTTRPMRSKEYKGKIQSGFAYLPDVSVTCSSSDFVVRVKPTFYGLGAGAEELKLGSSCRSNGILRPYGDLIFTYPLMACDAVRQSPPGFLVYKFVLHYEPSPKRFPSRAHRMDVNIECRYQRNHHVYQLTVKPTWETAVMRKRLKGSPDDFRMELMDDSWNGPSESQEYQLGKTINFQVSAPHIPMEGKLYINSCYATPSTGSKSTLKYTIIDNFGCMMDSKRDPGASQFISRTDKTLRFSLKAFQFTSDPDTEVSVHCKLIVTSEDPSPAHKSCTYRGDRWTALSGDDSVCECCDSRCGTLKAHRAMIEGSASSGSLLVSDQPYTAEDGFLPIRTSSVSRKQGSEAIISHYINELNSQEELLESVDVKYDEEEEDYTDDEEEGGVILGGMAKPDAEESGFMERFLWEPVVNQSVMFEEGSGYLEDDFSESEDKEGKEETISDQEEQTVPSKANVQRELEQPYWSEDEQKNRRHADQDEKEDGMITSEVEKRGLVGGKEQTWYFSWR